MHAEYVTVEYTPGAHWYAKLGPAIASAGFGSNESMKKGNSGYKCELMRTEAKEGRGHNLEEIVIVCA